MTVTKTNQINYGTWLRNWWPETQTYLTRPIEVLKATQRAHFSADFLAGLTVAFVMLPQAIAYALIAELPAQTGLYAAIIGSIVGALWGSSWHLHTGPTNAASLLVLATLAPLIAIGTPEYVAAAALMAIMVGITRLAMGLVKLGALVNFVADSVIVGFTAGAGILIGVNQLRHLLRLEVASDPLFLRTFSEIVAALPTTHGLSLGLGLLTTAIILILQRVRPRWPGMLISIVIISSIVALFSLDQQGVYVLGELPRSLPAFAMPDFDYNLVQQMSTGVLAISLIGLIEAMSIAQSIASRSGQRLDNNQEFVGQGLANIAAGMFSGYTGSGSFTRSAINYDSGAKSPLSMVFSGITVLALMLILAPYAAYLPRTALAAIIILTAYRMVNRDAMRRIMNTSQGDTVVMFSTILATLFLPLQFAVLTGIMVAFMRFIGKTSTPTVTSDVPTAKFDHIMYDPEHDVCPQLAVITISGSLYFGATSHVEQEIRKELDTHPQQIHALLRMHRVNDIDVSGINMLETIQRLYRQQGGDIYLTGIHEDVFMMLEASNFVDTMGRDHFLMQDDAIGQIFHKNLDPVLCVHSCKVRIWRECQILPKSSRTLSTLPSFDRNFVDQRITPEDLSNELQSENPPQMFDVRTTYEYLQDHIEGAKPLPVADLFTQPMPNWNGRKIVVMCTAGRRSARAAQYIQTETGRDTYVLDGGLRRWKQEGLPVIVE